MDPSELRMNLAALQRVDPYIKTILLSASQVALYRYVNQEWNKTDAEGTLFVYERKCDPRHGFLILNRLSADNWIQPINPELDSEVQPPFLLYKTKDLEIYGIWFYEEEKCRSIGRAIEKYTKMAEEKSSNGRKQNKMDLSSLLNKAATDKNTKESPSGGEKLLRLLKKGSEPPVQRADEEPKKGPDISSVTEFFAQASQQEQHLPPQPCRVDPGALVRPVLGPVPAGILPIMQGVPPGMTLLPQQPGVPPMLVPIMRPPVIPAIQSLMANPGVVSLESLERQHREESCTPPASSGQMAPITPPSSQHLEMDLKNKLNINSTPGSGKKKTHRNHDKSSPAAKQQSYSETLVSPAKPLNTMRPVADSSKIAEDGESQLLSPMMFSQTTPVLKDHHLNGRNGGGFDSQDISPLTKTQLAQAMQHLLRTDPAFVGKLHQAYVESLNNKLN